VLRTARMILGARALPRKARSYIRAETGGRQPLTGAAAQARLAACTMCSECEREGPEKMYCAACECPQWKRAELHIKATLRGATCPLNKWEI
jgi:hypothetical protein